MHQLITDALQEYISVYKIILLTSMVTLKKSYAAGDVIECENDQAWRMINDRLGKLKGTKKPSKPKSIIDEEKALEDAEKSKLAETDNKASLEEREADLIEREKSLEEKLLSLDESAQAK